MEADNCETITYSFEEVIFLLSWTLFVREVRADKEQVERGVRVELAPSQLRSYLTPTTSTKYRKPSQIFLLQARSAPP